MNTLTINAPEFLTIPLTEEAHQQAQKFASVQPNIEKKKQVYLNTLAVFAVNRYLKWIQIETDLEGSDSYNLAVNSFFNASDLELPNIGKLICIPVLPDQAGITTPEILANDAIAYIPVRFKNVLDEVDLLGYRPITNPDEPPEIIDLEFLDGDNYDDGCSLFPLENLLNWLFEVEDIRSFLEQGETRLIKGIRKYLEAKNRSLSQAAVEANYRVKTEPEDRYNQCGENFLRNPNSSQQETNLVGSQLRNLRGNSNEEEINQDLAQLGGQFLREVKQLITGSPENDTTESETVLIPLKKWLQPTAENLKEIAQTGWLTLEEMSQSSNPILRDFAQHFPARSTSAKRGKLFDIGAYLGDYQAVLWIVLKPVADEKISILVQVRPVGNATYLTPNLELILLDSSGTSLKKITSRNQDNWIQLELTVDHNDQFSLQLQLDDKTITEKLIASY
jgi:hypothetical protein